jgi:hypothetical protein
MGLSVDLVSAVALPSRAWTVYFRQRRHQHGRSRADRDFVTLQTVCQPLTVKSSVLVFTYCAIPASATTTNLVIWRIRPVT